MKIAIAASECVPFGKTGGLADIIGSLPTALKKSNLRNKIMVFLPYYLNFIDHKKYKTKLLKNDLWIKVGNDYKGFSVRKYKSPENVEFYFIENYDYFARPDIYGPANCGYSDNGERFIFFSQAVLVALKSLEIAPDILHLHDWQTALIPLYLRKNGDYSDFFAKTKTVFTIHNIDYQGIFPKSIMNIANISWSEFTKDKIEFYDDVNSVKAGIVYSDAITTVSKKYSEEICENGWISRGLEGILRDNKNKLSGILNGIDIEYWNPETDKFLTSNFSSRNLAGKAKCKEELQQICRLEVREDTLVLSMISRLVKNKGFDLVRFCLEEILYLYPNLQIVLIGTGETEFEDYFRYIAEKYGSRVSINITFNNELAHKVYAGSDIFLMPSVSEACGLSQMISFRYGAIPIVNPVGGLYDTVKDVSLKNGTGFTMHENSYFGFMDAVKRAVDFFQDKEGWKKLVKKGMKLDFSWERSSQEYLQLYKRLGNYPLTTSN